MFCKYITYLHTLRKFITQLVDKFHFPKKLDTEHNINQLLLANNYYIILYFLYYIFIPFYILDFAVLVLSVYVA
jgi:hypothetical protein